MFKKNSLDVYRNAMAYMQGHLFDKLKVEDIAQHCGISPSGLEQNFRKYGKTSVMRHFLDLRLDYAAKMLKEGYTVIYLAQVLNFSSPAHLSVAFKKKFGIPPLKYKFPLQEDV